MWNRFTHWWEAQGELAKLQGVSDRMLADMGLEREGLRDRVLARATDAGPQTTFACGPTTVVAQG
jgi:uncharacterized protein YjiS (DUF1127 family)